MVWLGLRFDTISMTVALPPGKLEEVVTLVGNWSHRTIASIHDLWALMGKLFYVTQCCLITMYFINRLLKTIRCAPCRGSSTCQRISRKT